MLSMDWIGGFFDADGCVGLSKRSRNRRTYPTIEFVPFISIGQSDLGILEAIGTTLGAKIYAGDKAGSVSTWGVSLNRTSYNLTASNVKAIGIAKALVPHTKCKTAELLEVIQFHEQYNNHTKGWAKWRDQSDEYERRRLEVLSAGDACRLRLKAIRANKDTR